LDMIKIVKPEKLIDEIDWIVNNYLRNQWYKQDKYVLFFCTSVNSFKFFLIVNLIVNL
jgi:hypothetical protein